MLQFYVECRVFVPKGRLKKLFPEGPFLEPGGGKKSTQIGRQSEGATAHLGGKRFAAELPR